MANTSDHLLAALAQRARNGQPWASSTELKSNVSASLATVKRHLEALVNSGHVIQEGRTRSTRYRLVDTRESQPSPVSTGPVWSAQSLSLRRRLEQPLAMRHAVTYQRTFVDNYIPNQSSLLPISLATTLMEEGRMRGQQPAGTYARKVLEPLLIDLSWSSSRLEGNRYSLLATEELFKSGVTGGDLDAVMLLNHKAAIEFMVDAVPSYGLTTPVIQNLHALLMQDLLADPSGLGTIRQKVVNISDTTYLPSQVPSLLGEMLECILEKARQIKNPVESAFFLWVNLAYLQPFDDGNKRTSRLAANIPLMLYNSAPLSFLDMDVRDYAHAMMGIYEHLDVSLAADLFEWAYRRSIRKYEVTLEAMGRPDPVRVQFREALNEAIGAIVRDRKTCEEAMADLSLDADQAQLLRPLLMDELKVLGVFNCARYRLTMKQTESWIDAGRPL
ncbi:Fic family protein [Pseudomonas gingeri]|uniref:Fic family protein n=1 Tax=Pseudomonas gingeri TaxID=117681 RepID=A0A7Y7Y716_9PSED|nr:Fic family protein [Pseudomonas gingeri]NWB26021.1 Fic family protein [Pseudomonas gingeri]NWC31037.1 Fic family protein [Pseudomonas gingeri]NWD03626.1 Fic family protein [Pseudomonas gingeri]NWE33424.1 Fic family protein [Pseudomonas gingeri]NWE58435.1 Fic family protein [Pseudomonas gingeri]